VSRITVANALRRLSSEGFVIVHPHRGAVVASLNPATLDEIFRIRYALESEVMGELATKLSAEGIARLESLDREVRESLLRNDTSAYRRLERQFHLLVYELSGLPMISSMLTDLWNRLEPYRGRRYTSQLLVQDALNDHRKILAALSARDPDSAVAAMRAHVERGHRQLLFVLAPENRAAEVGTVTSGIRPPRMRRSRRARSTPPGSLLAALDALPDARRSQGQMYSKSEILTLAFCAMLCGASSRYAIAEWIAASSPPIRNAVGWQNERIPSGPTIHRVFAGLEAGELEAVLEDWLRRQGFGLIAPEKRAVWQGVHGEELPCRGIVACLASPLREHLQQRDDGSEPDHGHGRSHWERFFGRVLYGDTLRSDVTPAELHLRVAFLHTAGTRVPIS
jgi:DNA-binding GntR family transcriptional regulator